MHELMKEITKRYPNLTVAIRPHFNFCVIECDFPQLHLNTLITIDESIFTYPTTMIIDKISQEINKSYEKLIVEIITNNLQ